MLQLPLRVLVEAAGGRSRCVDPARCLPMRKCQEESVTFRRNVVNKYKLKFYSDDFLASPASASGW